MPTSKNDCWMRPTEFDSGPFTEAATSPRRSERSLREGLIYQTFRAAQGCAAESDDCKSLDP